MKKIIQLLLVFSIFIGVIPKQEVHANESLIKEISSLNDIAWEDLSYQDIFVTNNLAYFNGFDEKSFEPYVINTGNPHITNEMYNTGKYSLEIKGDKPQQIRSINTLGVDGEFFVASKGYVTRYVQGMLGICLERKENTIGHTNITNGFETISGILSGTSSDRIFIGSINGANLDGYIDDTVVVNMDLFENKPTKEELTQLYENYVSYDKSIEKEEIKYTDQEKYDAFISYMNGKAKSLGMVNSTFKDSVGMDNLTTASDLAKLMIAANSYEKMKGIWNNPSYSVNVFGKNARVYDVSLSYYSSEIITPYYTIAGVKGGSLTKGNIRNLAVILDIPNSKDQLVIVVLYIDGGFNDRNGALELVKQLADLSIDKINNDKDISSIDVACQSAISIHLKENGETNVLYSKNENDIKAPASITKVLTAISVLDLQEDLNELLEYKTFDTNIGGFYIKDFLVGDQVTTYDALQALMIASSNSTAQVLARSMGEKILKGCEQGHDYETTTIQPTCTKAGYRIQTCKKCYHEVKENLNALGHDYEIIQGYNATFNENGLTDGKECKRCNDTIAQQVIPMITPSINLPSEYTYVKYLDSIGNAYIDTGIYAQENDKFILHASALSNTNHSLMGSCTNPTSDDRIQVHYRKDYQAFRLSFKGNLGNLVPSGLTERITFVLDLENNMSYVNGKIALEGNLNAKPSNNTIYLFSKNVNGSYDPTYTGDTRIYGYKHYRNKELLRDMVPCFRNSDYVYGMYDLVENKFYENAGQGSFSYDELNLKGKSGIVLNIDTNEIYYGKNLSWTQAMASTTKIMTCILAIENLDLTSRTLKTIQSDLVGGSMMGLNVGESLTVNDALYGLMLPSGNDVAYLLARTVAGSYEAFVDMMNQKAKELGMNNTHFSNPNGFDEDLYSSVIDMTTLMKYAMQNETFAKVVSTANYTIQADSLGARYHKLTNTNQLLTTYDGCIGGKTGTTVGSGAHLVVAARRHGTTLIAMILGSDSNNRYSDAKKLLDYGFEMAPDHIYEEKVVEPTCTEQGYTYHSCECGDCYSDNYVDALGHEYEIIKGYNATFNENGLTDGKECKRCGDIIAQQVIPMITPSTNLPSEYTYVKYLDSIGNAYIDTGIYALENDKFILYGSTLLNKKNHSLMGSGTSDSSNDRVQVHYSKNDLSYSVRFKGTMSAWIPTTVPSLTSFVLDLENNIGYINGQIAFEDNLNVKPSNNTIYLFSKNVNGIYDPTYTSDTRIYGYKHYRNKELLRDMVPCFRNSDYVYGMYDLVENKFYENAGQGSFSYDELNLKGKSGIVLNADTNEIYYGKNLSWKQAMASTTKIMTCILAIENLDLNSRTLKAIQSDLLDGTTMGLVVGESLTVKDALYGLMLPSGNDAAQLLARTVAGDYDSFLKMMNQKAQELGMTNTYFSNASGRYDEGLYSSVVDMTTLMKYAMQNETFAKVVSTANYTIQADSLGARYHKLTNTNQLLTTYDGCIGGKTGTTVGSGAHLVVVAKRHGTTLIAMILGSDSNNRFSDARKLLDYGFEMAPDHIYEEKVVEPTCTEQGYTYHSCECGDCYSDNYVNALGHSFTNYISNYDGTKTSKCDHCEETDTIADDFILGDIDGNGKVNTLDRMILSRYLAHWSGYDTINTKAADVNLDGQVNAQDRMILARHLARWQGYETLPYIK